MKKRGIQVFIAIAMVLCLLTTSTLFNAVAQEPEVLSHLVGTVVDSKTGIGISEASVEVENFTSVETGPNGSFMIRNIPFERFINQGVQKHTYLL